MTIGFGLEQPEGWNCHILKWGRLEEQKFIFGQVNFEVLVRHPREGVK